MSTSCLPSMRRWFSSRPTTRTRARKHSRATSRPRLHLEHLENRELLSVTIDSNWLAARGAGPYLLNQANTTYTLATDVDVPGTAFVVDAPNVTLDLNGHTITYGDTAPVAVANSGFEQGTGRSVPGWDLSQAPNAALNPNVNWLFGNQVLRVTNASSTQTITSGLIAIPKANHVYAATVTAAQATYGTKVNLSVIDAVTGQVLASGAATDPTNGYAAVVQFTPTTTDAVRLQITVTPPSGTPATVDLDDANVMLAYDYGIMATRQWSGGIPGWANLPANVQQSGFNVASNFTLQNGNLVEGQSHGYASHPLFLECMAGVTVQNMHTQDYGMDTVAVDAVEASGAVTVRNSTFQENQDNIGNRQGDFATLELNSINGPVVADGNTILGSPQIGIKISGTNPQYSTSITNNTIKQNAIVTNGYGICVSALSNFTISGNTIAPTSGRGIDLDGYSSTPNQNGVISNNYVSVQEHFNREYPTALEARALRIRNNVDAEGALLNLRITGNTFIATTGPGLAQQAFGARLSLVNNNGAMNNAGLVIQGNTFKAITTTTDPTYVAEAFVLDGVDPGINPNISNNIMESNDISLALTQADGGAVNDSYFYSNTLRKSSDGAVVPYTGVQSGFYNRAIHNVQLIDTRLDNGATMNINWAGTGTKDLEIGSYLSVVAQNGSTALPGVAVTLRDKNGNTVYSGTTASNGHIDNVPVITTVYTQPSSDPTQITTSNSGPFQFTASYNSASVQLSVDLTSSQIANVVSSGGSLSVNFSNGTSGTSGSKPKLPKHVMVSGADAGGVPEVRAVDPSTGQVAWDFLAYGSSFQGGVRVAVADMNGDGIPDIITAPGPGMAPEIRVFDGNTGAIIRDFMAYGSNFLGGVYVAAGDVNGDGVPDIVTGADAGGGPHVEAFSGTDGSLLRSFFAYNPVFHGGVRVAVGDVNGDGYADIITAAGPGGGPHVEAFSGKDGSLLRSFFAYSPVFTGGVYVSAGDIDGDGKADIITGAGAGGGPQVSVFSGATGALLRSYFAFAPTFAGGVRVSSMMVNGQAEILTAAGPSAAPQVNAQSYANLAILDSFFACDQTFKGGCFVGGL